MRPLNLVTLTNATDLAVFAVPPSFMKWAASIPHLQSLSDEPLTLTLPEDVRADLSVLLSGALPEGPLTITNENKAYTYLKPFLPVFGNEDALHQWAKDNGWVIKGDEFYGRLY